MAILGAVGRALVGAKLHRRWSARRESVAFTKPDAVEAIIAMDAWIDANAAAINQALPAAFRTTATPSQKAILFSYVAMVRFGDEPREN